MFDNHSSDSFNPVFLKSMRSFMNCHYHWGVLLLELLLEICGWYVYSVTQREGDDPTAVVGGFFILFWIILTGTAFVLCSFATEDHAIEGRDPLLSTSYTTGHLIIGILEAIGCVWIFQVLVLLPFFIKIAPFVQWAPAICGVVVLACGVCGSLFMGMLPFHKLHHRTTLPALLLIAMFPVMVVMTFFCAGQEHVALNRYMTIMLCALYGAAVAISMLFALMRHSQQERAAAPRIALVLGAILLAISIAYLKLRGSDSLRSACGEALMFSVIPLALGGFFERTELTRRQKDALFRHNFCGVICRLPLLSGGPCAYLMGLLVYLISLKVLGINGDSQQIKTLDEWLTTMASYALFYSTLMMSMKKNSKLSNVMIISTVGALCIVPVVFAAVGDNPWLAVHTPFFFPDHDNGCIRTGVALLFAGSSFLIWMPLIAKFLHRR